MPTIRVPPGIVRGETKAHVPGRWHVANLIRWSQGLMKPVGGWERMTQNPLLSIPRNAHIWMDVNSVRRTGVLCDGKVFQVTENVFYDITPTGFLDANSGSARGYGSGGYGLANYGSDTEARGGDALELRFERFSMDNWNDLLLFASSADGRIFEWNPATPATLPVPVTNAPTFVQGFLVTDEDHLMALGTQGHPNRIAWSDQGNRNGWDFTRVTGQAGFKDLEGAGKILLGVKIPGAILVFTSTSVWIVRYIGQPYYYGVKKIAEGCAPISAHAVAVAGSKAYWMGLRSFWKYEGGVVTPLPSTLGLNPFEDLDPAAPRRVSAGFNGAYPEVWFFYPEKQNLAPIFTENNKYAVFNFEEGWWGDGDLARTFYTSSPIIGHPIAGDNQTHLYQHETGYTAEGQPRGDMIFAEVGAISFDDGMNNWQVNQAQVDNPQGPESVRFDFKGRRVRGGPEVTLQTNVIPRANGFLDTHFTARDFSMRVEEIVPGPWGLGAMVFNDVKKRGPV